MLDRIPATFLFAAAASLSPTFFAPGFFAAGHAAQGADDLRTRSYRCEFPLVEPRVFAGTRISTGDYETHLALSPEGKAAFFVKSTYQYDHWTILQAQFKGGKWDPPEVAPFSGLDSDADPFLTADGSKLYFISDRPVPDKPGKDLDIWWVEKLAQEWSAAYHLDGPVNGAGSDEWFPCVVASGTLYFGSDRPGGSGKTDIWRAKLVDGRYGEPENLGAPVNSAADEYECLVSPDERYLVLMAAGRPGELGQGDLYLSVNEGGRWSEPKLLGNSINSPDIELGPALSPDGRYFFFSSTRRRTLAPRKVPMNAADLGIRLNTSGNGFGDIYQVDVTSLEIP